MVGFIGPDGVGKSSLLALLSGARTIQTGCVNVLGGDMARRATATRSARVLPTCPRGLARTLSDPLRIRERRFLRTVVGQSAAERAWRIRELLTSTGLAPFADRPAGKLSGGMKQKLGLCCALIHDPDLLILDEPTTGVDPLSRRQFWDLIARMRMRRPQMSVLVATAYMDEAEGFEWLIAMDAGTVLATGSPTISRCARERTLEQAFIALFLRASAAGTTRSSSRRAAPKTVWQPSKPVG